MKTWTTLRKLRDAGACRDRYAHLKKSLGRTKLDTPIDLVTILETNGLDDVLWIPQSIISGDHVDMRYRLFAVACAQDVLRLMDDPRSREAVKVAHLYAYGEAGGDALAAARNAAWDAARAAAWDAAWAAARAAARAAAWDAARDAARAAAWDAARAKQTMWFRIIFSANLDG